MSGNLQALTDIHGIGWYSALLIVAELGEVERFRAAKQLGAYAGLTARVHQLGAHCYQGSIMRQGSPWLRWVLVEAAMKTTRQDPALKNFYQRVRKRASAKIARVHGGFLWLFLRFWLVEVLSFLNCRSVFLSFFAATRCPPTTSDNPPKILLQKAGHSSKLGLK